MEQAEAGAGLQDVPDVHTLSNGHSKAPSSPSIEGLAVCASPGDVEARKRRRSSSNRKQRPSTPERESIGELLRKGVVEHQLGLSLNLVLLAAMTYLMFPSLRERVGAFFWLQYPTGTAGEWSQGPRDVYIVPGFVVIFTGLRAAFMDYVYLPLAGAAGIRQKKAKLRFAEQTHLLLYYAVYWTWGVALFAQSTPALTSSTMTGRINELLISIWQDFPHLTLTTSMKFYYLTQTAFWVQQIFVINIEERRKDHWQMFTHHIVTIVLLVFSYGYRQMRAGNAILALMDIVDLFFPLAKVFKYLGWQTACDAMFGLFVISWLAARHIGYVAVCWSIYAHVNKDAMLYGTYSTLTSARISSDGGDRVLDNLLQPFLNPTAKTVAFNASIRWIFLGLLGGLQVITIGWFVMICRVVVKVLQGHPADDSRSDDEGGDEEENETEVPSSPTTVPFKLDQQQASTGAEKRFIEVPASGEDLHYSSRPSSGGNGGKRKGKGKGGISSGLIMGEHKEILNRIGCLSDEQLARERQLREKKEASPRPGSGKGRRK